MIKAAKKAGVDAVKIQTYEADSMTINSHKEDFRIKHGIWKGQKLYDLYKTAQTPYAWHHSLFEFANLFSNEFSKRLGYSCRITTRDMDFTEPRELTNKTDISSVIDNYDPSLCWDQLLKYYKDMYL